MNYELDSFKKIWAYYISESQRLVNLYKLPVVLKTDLWNESHRQECALDVMNVLTGCKEVHGLELNGVVYEQALQLLKSDHLFPKQGSITDLPYDDDFFDVIVDLSTLDHVPQKESVDVLVGYARTLKTGGRLLLFIWTGAPSDSCGAHNQCRYDAKLLEEALNGYFKVVENGDVMDGGALGLMRRYVCEVKK